MATFTFRAALLILAAASFFASCKKKDEDPRPSQHSGNPADTANTDAEKPKLLYKLSNPQDTVKIVDGALYMSVGGTASSGRLQRTVADFTSTYVHLDKEVSGDYEMILDFEDLRGNPYGYLVMLTAQTQTPWTATDAVLEVSPLLSVFDLSSFGDTTIHYIFRHSNRGQMKITRRSDTTIVAISDPYDEGNGQGLQPHWFERTVPQAYTGKVDFWLMMFAYQNQRFSARITNLQIRDAQGEFVEDFEDALLIGE